MARHAAFEGILNSTNEVEKAFDAAPRMLSHRLPARTLISPQERFRFHHFMRARVDGRLAILRPHITVGLLHHYCCFGYRRLHNSASGRR